MCIRDRAAQFESFKMPFIIMLSIPFAFSGVILALLITRTTLSVIAALGAIMLIGIVTKNGIVLIDFINLMRERGVRLYDAIAPVSYTHLIRCALVYRTIRMLKL